MSEHDEPSWEERMEAEERRAHAAAAADARLNVALPEAPESEGCLLSMLMNAPGEIWQAFAHRLRPHLFAHPARLEMFMLVQELHTGGVVLELTTFTGMLRQRGVLDVVGGPAAVTEVWTMFQIPQQGLILHHLQVLEEMHVRRGMIRAAWGMVATARDTTVPWKKGLEKAEGDLFNLHAATSRRGTRHVREVVPEIVAEIQTAYANKGHVTSGMALGFTDLDRTLMGLKTGLFVIAARPSKGKTVVGCQIALNVGAPGVGREHYHEFNQGALPVLFFSLETTDRALTRRMLFNRWTVPITEARNGTISRLNQDKLTTSAKDLMGSQIYLHEAYGMSIQEMRATTRQMVARHGIKLVIVDYLQLLTSESKAAQYSRQALVAEVSIGLKHLAHEFDIPVIALAQLNREGDVARPTMAHLRECGQIEQDADYIAMICEPPEGVGGGGEDDLPCEDEFMGLDLVKNKDGPVTTDGPPIVLKFDRSIFRLRSMTDSLLSNNAAKHQAGYGQNKRPEKPVSKGAGQGQGPGPGQKWRRKATPEDLEWQREFGDGDSN